MGFRNPLTTASAVDTRTGPTAAGARMYTEAVPGRPGVVRGVVELADGQGLDTPARFTSTPGEPTGRSVGGGVVELSGGSFNDGAGHQVTGPKFQQNVELDGVGGFRAVTRVIGAALFTFDRNTAAEIVTTAAGSAWSPGWSSWDDGINQNLTFVRTADNLCHVSGYVRYTTGVAGATVKIISLGGNFVPLGLRHPLIGNQGDTFRGCEVRSDGLYLRGALPAASGFLAFNGVYPGTLTTTS